MTSASQVEREIVYCRGEREYAAYLNGDLKGYYRTYLAAEEALDELVYDLLNTPAIMEVEVPAATVHARTAATPQPVETYPIDPIELALAEVEVLAANPAHGKAIQSAVAKLLEMEFVHINQGKVIVRGSQTYRADGNTCPCGYNHKACWPRYSALLVETMRNDTLPRFRFTTTDLARPVALRWSPRAAAAREIQELFPV